MPLPLEWADRAIAPPGLLLVERVEMPLQRGAIFLPAGVRTHTRSNEALIHSVGSGVQGFEVGKRVLLEASVGRPVRFGLRNERTLWLINPEGVLADVLEEVEGEGLAIDESPAKHVDHQRFADALEKVHGEGDPGGLR